MNEMEFFKAIFGYNKDIDDLQAMTITLNELLELRAELACAKKEIAFLAKQLDRRYTNDGSRIGEIR